MASYMGLGIALEGTQQLRGRVNRYQDKCCQAQVSLPWVGKSTYIPAVHNLPSPPTPRVRLSSSAVMPIQLSFLDAVHRSRSQQGPTPHTSVGVLRG